mmetsp:Transcript_86160/g.267700  ORF Transcript_86160/g.267700 Transcript_86160/m.267700 type:complete len:445 (-) Transcript_86160:14-1348(-)
MVDEAADEAAADEAADKAAVDEAMGEAAVDEAADEAVVDEGDADSCACCAELVEPAAAPEECRDQRWLATALTQTPHLARVLGAATGTVMAFRLAALARAHRDWMLAVLPSLIRDTPADVFLLGGHRVDGRWSAGSNLLRLSMQTLEWESLPPMSQRRTFATAASAAGKVYVLGGFDGRQLLNSAERFDTLTRTWETLPPMTAPRYMCGATAIRGSLYVVGGVGNQSGPHDAYERFDTTCDRWEPVPPTSLGCSADVAVASVRQHLYVVGFLDGRSEFERLAPASGRWERLPPLQPGLAKNVLTGAVGVGNRLYVCSARMLAIRVFDCRTDTWEPPPFTGGLPDEIGPGRPICVTATGGTLFIVGTWQEKTAYGSDSLHSSRAGPATIGCVTYTDSRGFQCGMVPDPQARTPRRVRGKQATPWQLLPLPGDCLRRGCAAASVRC